jgi:hypothetical protein
MAAQDGPSRKRRKSKRWKEGEAGMEKVGIEKKKADLRLLFCQTRHSDYFFFLRLAI